MPERLLLAALLGEQRIGQEVGEVVTGPVGAPQAAQGLPVPLARRLCSVAGPGETLTFPATALAGSDALGFVHRVLAPTPEEHPARLTGIWETR